MIGVAVVGAGHWGPNLIRNFHDDPRSEVLWVIDRDAARLEEVRTRFPTVRVSKEPAEAFRDGRVDAVVVSTPTVTHYEIVKAALASGKHVLVEKPIATDARHAQELCERALAAQRVLMVGHVFLYNVAVQQVKRYIDTGELGRVYYASMVRTNLGPIRVDVNAAWDLASHDIAIVNYWLGTEPVSATAYGGAWLNPGIEDAVFATLRYPDGVLAHLHASWLHPRKTRDVTVVGDRRMLTFDDLSLTEPLRIFDKQVTDVRTTPAFIDTFASFRASVRDGDIIIPKIPPGEPLKAECDHFLECIGSGAQPRTGGQEGLAVVRALEAIQRSLRQGGREEKIA
ncbi:MAG: Gfo/Idh/MocA family oxidoreductase [Deltaproteobacteria bacterium]|nr:Gfo/Idh/MocA family oxidoreductase [Deltaproteobacteria bacterium]